MLLNIYSIYISIYIYIYIFFFFERYFILLQKIFCLISNADLYLTFCSSMNPEESITYYIKSSTTVSKIGNKSAN